MMERIDSTPGGLFDEEVVQIGGSAFSIHGSEPHGTKNQQHGPGTPSPVCADFAPLTLYRQKDNHADQRYQDSYRSLGKDGQKDPHRKQPLVAPEPVFLLRSTTVYPPEGMQCQNNKHTHQHVHPQHHGRPDEKDACIEHQLCCSSRGYAGDHRPYPTVHHPQYHQRRHHRKETHKGHEAGHIVSEECTPQHHQPQIERRFVGVSRPVVIESKEVPVTNGLIGNAQVAQFIVAGHIAKNEQRKHRDEQQEVPPPVNGLEIFFHISVSWLSHSSNSVFRCAVRSFL